MARKVKEEDYASRRNEILDAAQTLVYSKGYEQMSIQDIIAALKISKGAFYHYFDSKAALLEALIDRFADDAEKAVSPILDDPNLSALEKLQQYFSTAVQWKVAQKDYLLAILRVWYSDDNAILREKMFNRLLKRYSPYFIPVIKAGILEGSLSTPYPEQAMEIALQAIYGLGNKFGEIILGHEMGTISIEPEERYRILNDAVAAHEDAMERILGAKKGSIQLMDSESIRKWIE